MLGSDQAKRIRRSEKRMTSNEKQPVEQFFFPEEKVASGQGVPVPAHPKFSGKPPFAGVPREKKTIQDLLLSEGLDAVRLSVGIDDPTRFQEKLQQELSQNSAETRRRYAQSIIQWFFWDGINGLARQTWQAYGDEQIEISILRYLYLTAEPVVGNCVAQYLFPLEEGMLIPPAYFERYLRDALGEQPPAKTLKRLKMNLAKLGFLDRTSPQGDRLNRISVDKTAFLVVFHSIFSSIGPRTIELSTILQNPFWKHMGLKSEQAVKAVLREADAARLLGKYIVADQLEQVTTCFSLPDLLKRRAKL